MSDCVCVCKDRSKLKSNKGLSVKRGDDNIEIKCKWMDKTTLNVVRTCCTVQEMPTKESNSMTRLR